MNRGAREVLAANLKAQAELELDIPPVVSLEDYFEGNTDEYPFPRIRSMKDGRHLPSFTGACP
jgi:hypothetical protein